MLAGKLCQRERAISHQRGEHPGVAIAIPRHGHGNVFYKHLGNLGAHVALSRGCFYGPFLHACAPSGGKFQKPIGTLHDEGKHPRPVPLQTICGVKPRQGICRRCQSYLSSDSIQSSQFQPRGLSTFSVKTRQCQNSEHAKPNRTCAYYKSEEYDITEAKVDSLASAEGSTETVLGEGNVQEVSSWWEQFPKRWVIVLLCFTAFLLCNMDRVSIFMVLYL
jgi:ACS family sodium-dependent inorganic phosphate cotransporter